jgi:hypothetical protein
MTAVRIEEYRSRAELKVALRTTAQSRIEELAPIALSLDMKMQLAPSVWMRRRWQSKKEWIDGIVKVNERMVELK